MAAAKTSESHRDARAVLADAMRLTPQERELVSRWLAMCIRAGLDLDPDSVADANPAELSKLFGDAS